MATQARGVIDKGDELALYEAFTLLDAWAEQGVALPGFVGVGFGKGQTFFVGNLVFGRE